MTTYFFALMLAMIGTLHAEGVSERLADTSVLRGRFEQVKQLQGFRNPLRSAGVFLLARGKGVVWETRKPFPSTIVLTRDRLRTREADGRERVLLEGNANPAAAALHTLLPALIAGDLKALSRQFELVETLHAQGGWSVRLTPQADPLRRIFAAIELGGDRYVRSVRIEERGGDRSEIRFLDLVGAPARLTAEEAARFD